MLRHFCIPNLSTLSAIRVAQPGQRDTNHVTNNFSQSCKSSFMLSYGHKHPL